MARFLGCYRVWYVVESKVPPAQVDLSVGWVYNRFYQEHGVKRDGFLEICIEDEGKNKSIFVLARCLSPNVVKKGYIGLQYDNLKRLGLPTRPDSKTVKIYQVHWLRGIFPYLVHHPNPLVRYQFWLSTAIAGFGILLALIGFSI